MNLRALVGALWFLQSRQFANVIRLRVRRMRQPKYLVGAIFGLAYFYNFFLRSLLTAGGRPAGYNAAVDAFLYGFLRDLAPILLFCLVAMGWIFSGPAAVVQFSEAELAFLLPGPLTRRWLVRYSLLRGTVQILFSALIFALVAGRFGARRFGYHLVGWWLILATMRLHSMGAGFAIQRLSEKGLSGWRRRTAAVLAAALVLGSAALWIRSTPPMPALRPPGQASRSAPGGTNGPAGPEAAAEAMRENAGDFGDWAHQAVRSGPGLWLFAPFRWLVEPWFSQSPGAFALSLGPALGLLALHLIWVDRSDASFEEASIARARRVSEMRARMRSGKQVRFSKSALVPLFTLAPRGWPGMAFVWRQLLFPRRVPLGVALGAAAALIGPAFLGETGQNAAGILAVVMLACVGILVGLSSTGATAREFPSFEIYKTYPARGLHWVTGMVLGRTAPVWAAQTLAALMAAAWFRLPVTDGAWSRAELWCALGALWLVSLPAAPLFAILPTASALYFPGWVRIKNEPQTGFEMIGPRLLLGIGMLTALSAALLPAAGLGFLGWWLGRWIGSSAAGWLLGGLLAAMAMAAEAAAGFWFLGRLFDGFDVTEELH